MKVKYRNNRGYLGAIALSIIMFAFLLDPVSGAVIEVSNSSTFPGVSSYSLINLSGFDNFGVADIDLYYDPGVVNITSASLGFNGYGGSLTPNINNDIGMATFLVMVSDIPGPNSPLTLLNVSLQAVGQEGNSNAIGLVISTLADTNGISPANLTVNNGTFRVLPTLIPPASVTNLMNVSYAKNYINWTWNDPVDFDLYRVMVYLNGVFQADVFKGEQYFNATGLAQGSTYIISTRTVDTFGNINATWVNNTSITSTLMDTTIPVITRLGTSPVTVEVGSVYTDAGATAFDNYDGNITASIVTINPVNTAVKGTYTITYNVNDSSGNAAIQVTRTVHVMGMIRINNGSAFAGNTVNTAINLTGIDNFGEAIIDLYYNQNIVNITNISLGFSGYNGSLSIVNNTIGKLIFNVTTPDGPNSPLILVNVTLKATGTGGQTSDLGLVVQALNDTAMNPYNVIVSNGTFTILTTYTPPPSNGGGSGGGGGGGGGGGTSGENFSNIVLKEKYDRFIYKDKTTSYCFKNISNPVICVNITGNINAGEINVAIEVLKGISSLVNTSPESMVNANFNIWAGTYGFATPQKIKEATITFRVSRTWIIENRIYPDSITLMHYSNGWNGLPTEKIGENDDEIYYEAHTTSFSHFAIAGKEKSFSSVNPAVIESQNKEVRKSVMVISNETESPADLNQIIFLGLFVNCTLGAYSIYKFKKLNVNDFQNLFKY